LDHRAELRTGTAVSQAPPSSERGHLPSAPVTSSDSSDIDQLDLSEVASSLENLLIARGRGSSEREHDFKALRKRLLEEAPGEAVPSFLRTVRNLQQFWGYIRKWPTYAQRDEQIWSAFAPLHETLEREAHPEASAEEAELDQRTPESLRPQVTRKQRAVLDELRRIYLEWAEWPTHAYLEQQLEDQGIDLDDELLAMPELTFSPDNRRMGGGLFYQEGDKISLLVRGLVACSDAEREVKMFIATIKWAVAERQSVRQLPHEVMTRQWRAADAMRPMADAIGEMNPLAYSVKLVLEVLRSEPTNGLPRWSGLPEAFPDWQLDIPADVRRFRHVETIDDYLQETQPKPPPTFEVPSTLPRWPETVASIGGTVPNDDHPIFGRLLRRPHTFDCFVLLPLKEPFKTVYSEVVEPVAAELGISCGHAEGIFGPGRIMRDVVSSITFADVIVAELTGRNPNVFYELGIAHQQGKQVVLLSQTMDDVPFDVRDLRVVVYKWDEAAPDPGRVIELLRPNLAEAIRAGRSASG
jgi:hypothetical protein